MNVPPVAVCSGPSIQVTGMVEMEPRPVARPKWQTITSTSKIFEKVSDWRKPPRTASGKKWEKAMLGTLENLRAGGVLLLTVSSGKSSPRLVAMGSVHHVGPREPNKIAEAKQVQVRSVVVFTQIMCSRRRRSMTLACASRSFS